MDKQCERFLPVVSVIDVEPDLRLVDRFSPAPWTGYERTYEFFTALRDDIRDLTKREARFNWFFRMDPQIAETYGSAAWAAENYPQILEDLLWHGDGFGVHPHAWRWNAGLGQWFTDHADQDWVENCVLSSLAAFRSVFGTDCEIFRFGDRWMNNATMRLLDERGILCDLTVEPGLEPPAGPMIAGERVSGTMPDYSAAPRDIYYPAKWDYLKTDGTASSGLRVMPLTTGRLAYRFGRLEKLYRRVTAPDLLNPFYATLKWDMKPAHFYEVLQQNLSSLYTCYLTIAVRSDAAARPEALERMQQNARTLLSFARKHGFQFKTPQETLEDVSCARQAETLLDPVF